MEQNTEKKNKKRKRKSLKNKDTEQNGEEPGNWKEEKKYKRENEK